MIWKSVVYLALCGLGSLKLWDPDARSSPTSVPPEGPISTWVTTAGQNELPDVAFGGGLYLCVWANGGTIHGQYRTPMGVLSGASFQIATTMLPSGADSHPTVCWDPVSTGFVVAWDGKTSLSSNWDIFATLVPPASQTSFTVVNVSQTSYGSSNTQDERMPDLGASGDLGGNGASILVCEQQWPTDRDVVAFRRTATGTWGSVPFPWSATADEFRPAISHQTRSGSEDDLAVVWVEIVNGQGDIRIAVIDNVNTNFAIRSGFPAWVSQNSADESEPDIAGDDPSYAVVYQRQYANFDWDIYAHSVSSPSIGGPMPITLANQREIRPSVADSPANEYLITYARGAATSSGSPWAIAVARISTGATVLESGMSGGSDHGSPAVAADSGGSCARYLLAWDTNASGQAMGNFQIQGWVWTDGTCPAPPPPPTVTATQSATNLCSGGIVNYCANVTGTYSSVSWNFPGGTPSTSTALCPSVAYAAAGSQLAATVTVSGTAGSATATLTPVTVAPVVSASINTATPGPFCTQQTVTFLAQPLGPVTGYSWTFPGGVPSTSTATSPTVTFSSSGNITASLVVTGPCGPSAPIQHMVTIGSPPSVSSVFVSSSPCVGTPVLLTTNATGNITAYNWLILGAQPCCPTGPSPSVVFPTPGSYSGLLTVQGPCGVSAPIPFAVNVQGPPLAQITASPSAACVGETITLSATGTGTSFLWTLPMGSPSTATGQSVMVTYATPGSHPVTLTAVSPCGSSQTVHQIQVSTRLLSSLTPAQIPTSAWTSLGLPLAVIGQCFQPSDVVFAQDTPCLTTWLSPSQLQALIPGNLSVPAPGSPGGIVISVASSSGFPTNRLVLTVGAGQNEGHQVITPYGSSPGSAAVLSLAGGAALAPLTLAIDPALTTVYPFPDVPSSFVLGVGSPGMSFVFDGLGIAPGSALPTALDSQGGLSIPLVLPTPPLWGSTGSMQAAFLDPSSPLGMTLTWPSPLRL